MKPNNQSQFTNRGDISQEQQPKQGQALSNWYKSIYDIPLWKFEEVLLSGTTLNLTISGTPSIEDLNAAWEQIMVEYTESMGDHEFGMVMRLKTEIHDLWVKEMLVTQGSQSLLCEYSKLISSRINELLRTKYEFKQPVTNRKYIEDCESAIRRAKGFKITREMRTAELENIEKKMETKSSKEIDRNYFTSVLITLERGLKIGYKIGKDIFVNEYCEYVRQYGEYCKEVSDLNRKGKN